MKLGNFALGLLAAAPYLVRGESGADAPAFWDGESDRAVVTVSATVDCRTVFPVASLEDEALKGLMYSANGWELAAVADASRTATITAQAGTFANGVFTPDLASAEVTVAAGLTGEGTFDWNVTEISKKVYRLMHTARKGGTVDVAGTCYGYFDFSRCAIWASQADVEAAVLGASLYPIVVVQDETWPWQPIDISVARSGLATDGWMEAGEETSTTFGFTWSGILHYEYDLGGGVLEVWAGENLVESFDQPTGWTTGTIVFEDVGEHVVSFVYKSAGGGLSAGIRNVYWEETGGYQAEYLAEYAFANVRADFQTGEVRTPRKFSEVLPFVYSPTNFTGTIDGKSSRVSVVRLEGDDPDVTKWAEVPGTVRRIKEATDEGEVIWRAKKGVWKATFEIFDGETLKGTQIKYFDLRNATGSKGLVLFIT